MIIGQIAKQSGVSKDTVRLYTQKGLIESRPSMAGSRYYADYGEDVTERIKSIKMVQTLGFTLNEIKLLLDEVSPGCTLNARQLAILDRKLQEIAEKQRQLTRLQAFITQKITNGRPKI